MSKYTFTPEDIQGFALNTRNIKVVLSGRTSRLRWAFIWKYTPQGRDHWEPIAAGDMPLSDDDREYLQALLEAAQ